MKRYIIILLLLVSFKFIEAQELKAFRIQLRTLYAQGRMSEWEHLIHQMEKVYTSTENREWLEELVWAQYGYIAYLLHSRQDEKAGKYLQSALSHVDKLLKYNPKNANCLALKSSLTAFRIQLRPYAAPFLGPRSVRLMEEAVAADADNFRVLTEKGLARLYAPSWAGGNPEEAVSLFFRAVDEISKKSEMVKNDWYYLLLMASLGQSLQKTGRNDKAVEVYTQVLSVEPTFYWIKNELLPKALSAKN